MKYGRICYFRRICFGSLFKQSKSTSSPEHTLMYCLIGLRSPGDEYKVIWGKKIEHMFFYTIRENNQYLSTFTRMRDFFIKLSGNRCIGKKLTEKKTAKITSSRKKKKKELTIISSVYYRSKT